MQQFDLGLYCGKGLQFKVSCLNFFYIYKKKKCSTFVGSVSINQFFIYIF